MERERDSNPRHTAWKLDSIKLKFEHEKFIEKLNNKKDIKIVESLSGNISWADEGNSMVVSTPLEIWSIIKLIPAFKVANIDSIRNFYRINIQQILHALSQLEYFLIYVQTHLKNTNC